MTNRRIDQRFLPDVKGIDLEQSLNYLDLDDVGVEFIYDNYTSSYLYYQKGSRPELEGIVEGHCCAENKLGVVKCIAEYIIKELPWAGFYTQKMGTRLPSDRAMTEEELLASGYAWCNEQARVFCALAQIAGIPARLVFGCNKEGQYGHVVTEVLIGHEWLLVDQSFGFCFLEDGKPVNAYDVFHQPDSRQYFEPVYKQMCNELAMEIDIEILRKDFKMSTAENPLDGFKDLGFHNYFIH